MTTDINDYLKTVGKDWSSFAQIILNFYSLSLETSGKEKNLSDVKKDLAEMVIKLRESKRHPEKVINAPETKESATRLIEDNHAAEKGIDSAPEPE